MRVCPRWTTRASRKAGSKNEPTTATNKTKRILSTPDEGNPSKAERETPSNTITGNSGQFAFVPAKCELRGVSPNSISLIRRLRRPPSASYATTRGGHRLLVAIRVSLRQQWDRGQRLIALESRRLEIRRYECSSTLFPLLVRPRKKRTRLPQLDHGML